MIKRILASTLQSRLPSSAVLSAPRPSLLPSHLLRMAFSEGKGGQPRNKQEAWMMQEQKNLKAGPSEDEMEGKTYEGATKIGIAGMLMLASGLGYMYYSAGKKSSENLDMLEVDISGLKELKHKEVAIGGDWTLTNTEGQPFSSRNLTGSYYLIFFGYAQCPDICPSTLYYLSSVYRIIRNLPEGAYMKLKLVFVSVDPERDSPAALKSYLSEFGKNIIGVSGASSEDIELRECLRKFKIKANRVYYTEGVKKGSYEIDHTTRVYLMDPDNRYLDHLDPYLTEQQTAKAIVARIVQHEHKREKAEQQLAS